MELLGLPAELIQAIIVETIHEGFESLVMSCRAMYVCGKPFIAQYNAIRGQWRHLRIGSTGERQRIQTLILKIAEDPAVARYIQSVEFFFCRRNPGMTVEEVGQLHSGRQKVEDLMKRSRYLQSAGADIDRWTSEILTKVNKGKCQMAAVAFFLTLLPNVKRVSLDSIIWDPPKLAPGDEDAGWIQIMRRRHLRGVDYAEILRIIDVIVQEARSAHRGDFFGAALSKLRHLSILPSRRRRVPVSDMEEPVELEFLSRFLALENLEEAVCESIVSSAVRKIEYQQTGSSWIARPSPRTPVGGQQGGSPLARYNHCWPFQHIVASNLRSLDFTSSNILPGAISAVLAHTPRLESLRYSYLPYRRCRWNAKAFFAAVSKHCGNTLKSLYIVNEDGEQDSGGPMTLVTSLRGFTCLEVACLDAIIFYPKPGWYQFERPIPPLTETLPPSLIRLCLNIAQCNVNNEDLLVPLFAGFRDRRTFCLPRLDSCLVRYRCWDTDQIQHTQDLVLAAGAEFDLYWDE